ncbi:unnamed protein product [Phytomonas sp. Hart1]|nr:unnamed protein product [Phytomonas sp. Hart1]|eukprot:CCW70233.1 unnamed protein product [Phytomonas sp. isolate Hart1]
MDSNDTFFLSIGAHTTRLWKSEAQVLFSHVAPTPKTVSALKCNKDTTTGARTEGLCRFLLSLWRVHLFHLAGRVLLLVDPDDHPQFGRLCLRVLAALGLSQFPRALAVTATPFPLFAARLHGTSGATVVVDLGHICTRVVPIAHGIILSNSIAYCAGLGTVPFPGTSFEELFRRFSTNQPLDLPEDHTKTELVPSALDYLFALEESLHEVSAWCRQNYLASCVGVVTVCGGGSDIPGLRHLIYAIVQKCETFGRVYWS